ncbi:hypothetical protein EIP91_000522 [Steccherinum ochraceum]|uniref:Uncharacterized protein n=1 Tax=Steccherinum ochraceum TaxID=92696 RepID=A0A4R0RU58_9APHY|nr:hypothetical protein EIP91_000522 [Steccherinum ochraceum]
MASMHNLSRVLVRQEYVDGVDLINEFSKHPREVLEHHFFTSDESDDQLPLMYAQHWSTIGDTAGSEERAGGVSVVGHPGTGKSLLLQYTLLTRLLCRRTTIYADESSRIFIFNEEGVFQVYDVTNGLARELSAHIPPSAWCLVDCSPSLPQVPDYLLHLNLFIVQATCSSSGSFDWMLRTNRITTKYFIKPWSLPELIAARDLHLGSARDLTEVKIATNFDLFGPSPRPVFTGVSVPHFHRTALDCAAQLRAEDALANAVRGMKRNDVDPDIRTLLVIQPEMRRDVPQVVASNRYACKVLETEGSQSVRTLVDDFHAPAEFVLESVIRKYFTRGGTFTLSNLKPVPAGLRDKPRPPSSWTFMVPTQSFFQQWQNPDAWLRVGYAAESHIHITKDKTVAAVPAHASPVEPTTPYPGPSWKFQPMTPITPLNTRPPSALPLTPLTPSNSKAYYRWLAHPSEVPPSESEEIPPTPVSVHFTPDASEVTSSIYGKHNLKTGFIPPRSKYEAPYDFIAFNTRTCNEGEGDAHTRPMESAIIFEAFYASDDRSFIVSTLGIKWLISLGVRRISYVAVLLGPHPETTVEFHKMVDPLVSTADVDFFELHFNATTLNVGFLFSRISFLDAAKDRLYHHVDVYLLDDRRNEFKVTPVALAETNLVDIEGD